MGNRYDNFYGYTGMFPVLRDVAGEAPKITSLRRCLSELENGQGSLFSRTGLVHGARLFLLDDVVYNGAPSPQEHLDYAYVVLSITFDGDLAELAFQLAEHGGEEWDAIFSHCYGFMDYGRDATGIINFLSRGQVTTSFLYVDASADLKDTLSALALQREIGFLLEQAQLLDTAGRKKLIRELAAKMAAAPDLIPGDFHHREAN
ncbi:hypothetical protein N9M30_02025 [Pseudomonadales bacterium]|nr:hypothetical protein [Betaproteobacteria bacterium]MDA8702713.1 hypothetical protein [Pseudomonadales bacterium]